ncbi:uncharacterized protein HD556DRAFT_1304805 [Suillus plorans]|uniref:Uncharacterized protein n=1 Tax=Suillus plorans TaxID=116603 RepID=A0A9P7J3F2_9AGAM|nr:uncharacterized protein HD556DRAFT_1304805 [Suillus plorans]KAG1800803.1 hypothetical protein HD556DRAFT_1304805 [Suillus plorans]
MHGFSTRAHSSAKIAALAALPGSCALDVHEETSVSARMNVTRMGMSAQSLDEYLDGRPDYNARTFKRTCHTPTSLERNIFRKAGVTILTIGNQMINRKTVPDKHQWFA